MKLNIIQRILTTIKNNAFILASLFIATVLFYTPIQHYITIGRFQHYGFVVFIFGMGYVLNTIWNWKRSFPVSRASGAYAGLFFVSVGIIFYACPWLDPIMSVMTDEQYLFRNYLGKAYITAALGLVILWIASAVEERNRVKANKQTASQ